MQYVYLLYFADLTRPRADFVLNITQDGNPNPPPPLRLVRVGEAQVQVDAWSYSQAIDASNALATWETSLELPGHTGHRPSYGWFTRPGKRANITMERSTIFNR